MRNVVPKRAPEDKRAISEDLRIGRELRPAVPRTHIEASRRALEASKASRDGHRKMLVDAAKALENTTVSTAVELMQKLPLGILEVYLLAEEVTLNRLEVIRHFPKVGSQARQRYLGATDSIPAPRAPAKKSPAKRKRALKPAYEGTVKVTEDGIKLEDPPAKPGLGTVLVARDAAEAAQTEE